MSRGWPLSSCSTARSSATRRSSRRHRFHRAHPLIETEWGTPSNRSPAAGRSTQRRRARAIPWSWRWADAGSKSAARRPCVRQRRSGQPGVIRKKPNHCKRGAQPPAPGGVRRRGHRTYAGHRVSRRRGRRSDRRRRRTGVVVLEAMKTENCHRSQGRRHHRACRRGRAGDHPGTVPPRSNSARRSAIGPTMNRAIRKAVIPPPESVRGCCR